MPKKSDPGPEFSKDREQNVILENLQRQFQVFGESLQGVHKKLGQVEERLDTIDERLNNIENDVSVIKVALPPLFTRVIHLEERVTALEKLG